MTKAVNGDMPGGIARMLRGLVLVVGVLLALAAFAARADAAGPQWTVTAVSSPTVLPPGSNGDEYVVTAVNTGEAATSGAVTIADTLPAEGVTATAVEGKYMGSSSFFVFPSMSCGSASEKPLKCTYSGAVAVGEQLRMVITVNAAANAPSQVEDEVTVSGGGAPAASVSQPSSVGSTPAGFGITPGSLYATLSTAQAGAHPNVTTGFTLNQNELNGSIGSQKDISVELPTGLVGNPTATPRCTMDRVINGKCPVDSAVGSVVVFSSETGSSIVNPDVVLIYNIMPDPGEPAAFAFSVGKLANVRFDASVSPSSGYRVRVSIADVTAEARVLSTSATFWGVPALHNGAGPSNTAGYEPVTTFGGVGGGEQIPLLTNPSQCSGGLSAQVSYDSWQAPGAFSSLEAPIPAITGCEDLVFDPSFVVSPDTLQAGAPAGYGVELKVPQNEAPGGVATPDVRDVEVAMPRGVVLSPSAATGLRACSEAQFERDSGAEGNCPGESKIGTVTIATPLLSEQVTGNVYVGEPECSPCSPAQAREGRMVRLLIEAQAKEAGVRIKLAGRTRIDQATGQLTTVFEANPQLLFSTLQLSLKGGPDAPLVNPSGCGPIVATANLTPWSSSTATEILAPTIPIAGCASPGFSPSLAAGMTGSAGAGAFSPFSVTISRPDGQRDLGSVSVHTPPGLLGMLSKVSLCGESQANEGTCPSSSLIGSSTQLVGPGSEPYPIGGGKVFLTGPYGGGPFGLSIVVPASAGPFTLTGLKGNGEPGNGTVVVRASIKVDPSTAAITITTNPIPTELDGIPLHIQQVVVNVNRAGFMFNPTNCNSQQVTGTISSSTGTVANVSYPFQAVNCATLAFHPSFMASTRGLTSKANGASLVVKVDPLPGQANIAKVDLTLPKQLPARLTTLQRACTEARFNANPAGCPEASFIGTAIAHTPILANPLVGPAILVSHGGAAFPDVEFILQDEGVTIVLDGNTQIKNGITYSKFETVPDAPISSFETVLPEGPHSALGTDLPASAHYNLCGQALTMPTTITGQNGVVVNQTTKIAVTGCKAVKAKPLTRAQKLTAALKACRTKDKGKAKAKRRERAVCEQVARRKFGPVKKSKSKKKK